MISIPDYASIFSDFNKNNIDGLSQISLCRITAKPNGEGVDMYYKEDSTANGWFPRPIIVGNKDAWKDLFQPDDVTQGVPIEVTSVPLMERGQRQSWRYDVQFERGEKKQFVHPCVSLPVNLNLNIMLDRLLLIPHQIPLKTWFAKSPEVLDNVKKLLTHRMMDKHISEWECLFSEFGEDNQTDMTTSMKCCLQSLVTGFAGPVQIVSLPAPSLRASVFADPLVFRGIYIYAFYCCLSICMYICYVCLIFN